MAAQRITFVLDLFNKSDAKTRARSDKALEILLEALTTIDELYLRDHPETPLLYSEGVVYMEEPPGAEDWQDIPVSRALKWADCLPLDTLVLRDDYTFAALGDLAPGDVIVGDGGLTKVLDFAITGEKRILSFDLDNGCTLRCSPEHRLFLQNGEEVRAHDVKVGDRLKTVDRLACASEAWRGDERLDPVDLAWLTGVYVADGWHDKRGNSFAISGDDEKPKRGKVEQKDRVVALLQEAGIHTHRVKKYVSAHDSALTAIMASAGARAPDKHVPDMRLTEAQVDAMLAGLETDASIATNGAVTYGTVSRTLALQTRVLFRMRGQSVHIRRWDEHGGLGENPIYRITVRQPANEETPKNWQTRCHNNETSAKVRGIREEAPELCADIETDTGKFYLPESDLIVHNCEDLACWRAAELRVRGVNAKPIATRETQADGTQLFHIMVKLPDGSVEDPSRRLGMR